MFRKISVAILFIFFAFALWYSPTFKEVAAGVAILLIGMIILEDGFKSFTEGPLQNIIQKSTNKLYKSIGVGFTTTALLQSSSLVSVVVISFISAGLMTLHSGIGVIFGANIGTTATAWLVSIFGLKIKISALSLPMIVFGVLLKFQKKENAHGLGNILAGLGLFFLGVHFMKEGFDSLSGSIDLAEYAVPGFWGLILFTGIGILMTIILQSSSATLALILTALAASQISYANALALAIGANVGTTITAVLGALSANIEGKRLAGAHLIFNLVTGLVALIFIYPLGNLVDLIAQNTGIAENNYTLKLSLFHTIFNVLGVLLVTPFINMIVRLLERVLIDKTVELVTHPKYLNEAVLEYPTSAIRALFLETKRLFEKSTLKIVSHGLNLHRDDLKSDLKLKKLVKSSREEIELDVDETYYQKIKLIYSKIIEFSVLAQSKFKLKRDQLDSFTRIKLANRYIVETIKNIRGLQDNVTHYSNSDNEYIVKEYDKLRKKVSGVLREIYFTSEDKNPQKHNRQLAKLKEKVKKNDILVDGTLDELIRKEKIDSEMATSLANDSANVAGILENLLFIAELLYIKYDTILFEEKTSKKEKNKA